MPSGPFGVTTPRSTSRRLRDAGRALGQPGSPEHPAHPLDAAVRHYGPIFVEIIQTKGNEGFGEGNFQAPVEAMEVDQRTTTRSSLGPRDEVPVRELAWGADVES